MVKKVKIGIVIDGVLRDTLKKVADSYMMDIGKKIENPPMTYDFEKHLKDIPENYLSIDEWIEDFNVEIFGCAQPVAKNIMQVFNTLQEDLKDRADIVLLSRETGRRKSATLFFLSKVGLNCNSILFVDKEEPYPSYIDMLVAANPVDFTGFEGRTFKLDTEYNKDVSSTDVIQDISELKEIIK